MSLSKSYIPQLALDFLSQEIPSLTNKESANNFLIDTCGVHSFFDSEADLITLKRIISGNLIADNIVNRREFGDYQTNKSLACQCVSLIGSDSDYEFILEPTCGKGNFIIAALNNIESVSKLVGIEIYKPYVWETKFKVLSFYLANPDKKTAEISIIHADVFTYDFKKLAKDTKALKTLIIGNPPWITNSELGTLDSSNLPKKKNSSLQKGFDALTGKSNFDLGEAVVANLFNHFQYHIGSFALLVKSIVIKNIVKNQQKNKVKIYDLHKYVINAKAEFDVSVNASLFTGSFGVGISYTCAEYDFYTKAEKLNFGWVNDKFVSFINKYKQSSHIDGYSRLIWRSGMKHDCSKIMELNQIEEHYTNKLDEKIFIEDNIVYRLLKSSDLKNIDVTSSRKFTIVTQRKIGQDTSYIKQELPKTYNYLCKNEQYFSSRKSSIYKGKPRFSIFGIGDYSFKLHKVAISGLYKKTTFSYVGPDKSKPIMLDDTCYFIGFNSKAQAKIAQFLLNSQIVQSFLNSIVFSDSKRSINKDILMRIDLYKVYKLFNFDDASSYSNCITYSEWEVFENNIETKDIIQPTLF
ncbi:MAG: hypothetical protein AB8G86_17605 [Saprospiraceae bacterium]